MSKIIHRVTGYIGKCNSYYNYKAYKYLKYAQAERIILKLLLFKNYIR